MVVDKCKNMRFTRAKPTNAQEMCTSNFARRQFFCGGFTNNKCELLRE